MDWLYGIVNRQEAKQQPQKKLRSETNLDKASVRQSTTQQNTATNQKPNKKIIDETKV
jgi:hypothetical protein